MLERARRSWLLPLCTIAFVGARCGKPVRAPSIVSQPSSVTVAMCQSATFAVAVSGTPPFNYEWVKDGVPVGGAAGATYIVSPAVPGDAGSYAVIVSNAAGSATSAAATLTVTDPGPPPPGPSVVATEAGNSVVRAGDAVVWALNGYVHATSSLCPGAVRSIVDDPEVLAFNLTTDGNRLFWADGKPGGGGIYAAGVAGEGLSRIAHSAFQVGGLALVGPQLVWTDMYNENIQTMPVVGGGVTTYSVAFPAGLSGPSAIGGAGQSLCWSDWNGAAWVDVQTNMIRCRTASGDPVTVASDQGLVSGLAVDGQIVYWVTTIGTAPSSSSAVRSVSVTGGNVVEVANLPASMGGCLFIDGGDLYWTSTAVAVPGGIVGAGALSRVPKDGSSASVTLVGNLAFPGGIYADAQFVYWAEYSIVGNGMERIMRIPK